MVRTFTGGHPPRNEMDEQEDTHDHLSETDDEKTPTRYATQPEQFQVPTGTGQRSSRPSNSQRERHERSIEPARTTELEERTRVLEMAMGKILNRLIPDDPLIPSLNRDAQPNAVVATRNSPTLSNIAVPTRPRGSEKLNLKPSLSKHSEELMKKSADLERQLAPLNLSITAEPYQEGFKIPHLETYDGSGDPDEHLHTYQAIMRIQNANDAMMYKVFPTTLKSTARRWYHKLPRHSIDSYFQLAKLFSNKFTSQRKIKRTATELMQVNQREGESLRDYMQRFNKATLDIDNVPNTICLSALLHGLKRGRFLEDLLENPPRTWNEVNDSHDQPPRREEKKKQKVSEQWGKPADFSKYANYIPLTLPMSQILAQIQHWVRRPPPPLYESPRADKNKHCDYHRTYGHNTEDCQHLKDELEFLARNGKLEGYVQKPHAQQPTQTHFVQGYDRPKGQRYQLGEAQDVYQDNQYPSEQGRAYRGRPFNRRGQGQRAAAQNQKDKKGVGYAGIPPPSGTINMISGGVHSRGQSARARKAYARQLMTVNKNRPLKRPSPDILYWSCFQKMQLNPSSLQKHEGPIYGFDNQPVPVEGVITLPIYVGSEPRFRMASVTFLVVKMESAFNAILGRATLCELKAVISQPHLYMKFPTPQGVGVLKGNQKMARACYQDTFKKEAKPAEPVEPVETVPLNPNVLERTDVFAWTTDEMPSIPTELTVHKLSTDPTRRPVAQKRRLFGPEKQAALDKEIQKLLQAGFIRRVEYSEWVSNPVLVKKPNGKWRMCIDFTNLNEVCPKDPHPLPNVEKLVERAAGHERMSFLDASSGYHQVQLLLDDQEKIAFYAGDAIYCYVMMPFGLKNARATYQKLVQIIFKLQIGRNIEVYVDDMIVTSVRAKDHIDDLDETFQNLRRAQMKLNPLKCTFVVESGKFLGYVVSKKGIEVNPEKVQAVQQMEPPKTIKDVQRLTGRVAALHRFIARSAERCLPFFKALRENKNFQWTDECQQAFDELKRYLASAPLLSKPVDGECLYLYLGVTEEAVSSVLLREENKNQKPICYVSKVLQGVTRCQAELPASRKGYFCFGLHSSVELSEYDLKFRPRTTIKGQAVTDFLVECISATKEEKAPEHPVLVLYVDGATNIEGSGAEAVLIGPDGFKSEHALRFKFQTTNNAAELKSIFALFQIDKIPRADNHRADELSKLASSQDINPQRSTIVEVLDAPSHTNFTVECQLLSTDPSTPSWTTSLINYLQSGELPEDESAAKLIKHRAAHFTMLDNQLYKQPASMPLLCCLTLYEDEYVVKEVHEGVCGTHIDGKTLARKLLKHGYYWPTMVEDAQNYVKRCPTCQFNADDIHMPGEMLSSLTSPWPFAQWGVDLLSPFMKGKGGCTYLVVTFGIPKRIIADNGPQFRAAALRSFCNDYGIELTLTSVYTPQSNGQAESANKIVLRGIKMYVLAAHTNWVDELNKVLLSCRITPSSATGETPFSLAYGAEAVIPVEVGLPSDRSDRHVDQNNEQLLRENLDLVEEIKEMSRIRNMAHQSRVAKFYNKRVRARQFQVDDLVLCKAGLTNTYSHMGKLAPNWEGPYMVVQVKRPGSYVLADIQRRQLPYIWNIQNLKKFYS
ncbi:hypothetical protein SLEP1_g28734 [Rubroshorea leprosula]|uniref:Integrase catalytic domain-containing protein n=1 Tax=Rubroshorea leprosula TaxID=152421 RepID=A0AAV5K1Q4_9ROSI|nr:hypothetical protein SLEP1_g28734 [Rubroshorea leprosula]